MPEKMTKEEAVLAHTIDQLRVVKELIKKEKNLREAEETRERTAYDSLGEEVKVKRPKKAGEKDTTKIENNTGTHSGYGLAGQESHFKKSSPQKPTSYQEMAEMAQKRIQQGDKSKMLERIRLLANNKAKTDAPFNDAGIKEIIETAARSMSIEDAFGLSGNRM
jgi:hypothetical protein